MKVQNILPLLIFLLTSASCTIKQAPLKGTYQDAPFIVQTNKNYEMVWSNLIDLFAQKGLSIKVIDKSSGLIVSEKTSFLNSYTFETSKGHPIDSSAFVVLSKPKTIANLRPQQLTGEWNVRIKSNESGTIINVNLTNIIASVDMSTMYSPNSSLQLQAKSTGVFEGIIASSIK